MTWKRFIAAVVVLGVLAYLWAAYRALSGTTHTGQAQAVADVPRLGAALDWLRPRGPVEYVVVEHRGKLAPPRLADPTTQ